MAADLPLPTALSQVLIAHTIEIDEAFERSMPHSATVKHGAGLRGGGPWLVSHVMWSNYLRHVDAAGTPVRVLQRRACVTAPTIRSRLHHLSWWGYVTVGAVGADGGDVPRARHGDLVVRLTPGGARASAAFAALPAVVEERWRRRFGGPVVDHLRSTLAPFLEDAPPDLPRSLPVVDYGDGMRTWVVHGPEPDLADPPEERDLSTLLAQTLLRFTLDFEAGSIASLPHLADVLRVLGPSPVPKKALAPSAGVSKQAVEAALTFLVKSGLVGTEGKGAAAATFLTPAGEATRAAGERRRAELEAAWARRHGATQVEGLREALEALLAQGEGPGSKMAEGLEPGDGSWRAHKAYRRQTEAVLADPRAHLPHHPMVLHRGGYPDGS